jgi:ribosomal-protein-alanine N-acetyltransferase
MTTMPPRLSLRDQFERELHRSREGAAAGTDVRLVGETEDGRIAGFFTLSQIYRRAFQNAYAGWSVSADQIGKGLATEGVTTLLDLAFALPPKGLGLHRVQANVVPTNRPSLRVAEKTGFRLEGLAKAYLNIGGEWRDHLMLAKLSGEHLAAADDREMEIT